MQKVIIVILGLILALALAGAGLAENPAPGQAQVVCPVLGGKINQGVYADCQGQRVYFCCPGCVGRFQQSPEKYLQKMKEQSVTPEKSTSGN
jgi:YHS domain-containing protein